MALAALDAMRRGPTFRLAIAFWAGLFTLSFYSGPASTAEIAYRGQTKGVAIVSVEGRIVNGDSNKFNQLLAGLPGQVLVVLNSPGGALFDGLAMGETLRSKGYATFVTSRSTCTSVCGLIWLAGNSRLIGQSGRVGFHAAYRRTGDTLQETGMGNAMVGAYLTHIGLSYKSVAFLTSSSPEHIQWLHSDDAQRLGIQVETIPDPAPDTMAGPSDTSTNSSLEQRMIDLVQSYYSVWSQSGTDAGVLAGYYGDSISFYGSNRPRSLIIGEKTKFAVRWPTRSFRIRAGTLLARCSHLCAVTGVVEWQIQSAERGVRSLGAATFVLKIAPAQAALGGLIVSENGAVLSNRLEPLIIQVPHSTAMMP